MLIKGFSILYLAAILLRGGKPFSNFGRGSPKELFYEKNLKSNHCPMKCYLKVPF